MLEGASAHHIDLLRLLCATEKAVAAHSEEGVEASSREDLEDELRGLLVQGGRLKALLAQVEEDAGGGGPVPREALAGYSSRVSAVLERLERRKEALATGPQAEGVVGVSSTADGFPRGPGEGAGGGAVEGPGVEELSGPPRARDRPATVSPSKRPRQRPRRPPATRKPPPSAGRRASQVAIDQEKALAGNLLDELGDMAAALKNEAHGINRELSSQTRVLGRLEGSASDVAASVSAESSRMHARYRKQASSCCASWMQLIFVTVAFFFAVIIMRIFPSRVSLLY
uniref:Uncharacterized protein n=1 Tax=Rhizochromulina marina TaxID=1034831 RepID=A0A7S2S7M9_9STRA|mmetsp:Transcript_26030/g.75936  ORF Transcript_26030/g.75936 Transcript_26030/m.75936 type:complete len:285 (+) Transcript_26030:42-896(+)